MAKKERQRNHKGERVGNKQNYLKRAFVFEIVKAQRLVMLESERDGKGGKEGIFVGGRWGKGKRQ